MGIPTLILAQTADGDANVDFTANIDSTYDEYMFVFTDIGPGTDSADFKVQINAAGDSGFNEVITSTTFELTLGEDDSAGQIGYGSSGDQAEGTAYQYLLYDIGSEADQSGAGILHLFSPASTTYVKHFYSRTHEYHVSDVAQSAFIAGYINTTAAIDEVSFKISTGVFDGVIQMYGIS